MTSTRIYTALCVASHVDYRLVLSEDLYDIVGNDNYQRLHCEGMTEENNRGKDLILRTFTATGLEFGRL